MDKIAVKWIVSTAAVISALPLTALSGTVFMREPSLDDARRARIEEQQFPESRFGQPPIQVRANEAAREMETNDEDMGPRFSRLSGGWSSEEREYKRGLASVSDNPNAGPAPSRAAPSRPVPESRFSSATPPKTDMNPSPSSASSRKGVQEIAVIAGDLGYFPKTIFVTRDIPVRMYVTGASKNTLCIMMDSFQVRKQVRSNKIEEITFTPGIPGKFRFYCPVNGMEGTMVVKELTSTTDTSEAQSGSL